MDSTPRRVSLELADAPGPPTGTATCACGARREFSGWLGLIQALDALLGEGGPHADTHQMEA